MGQQIDIPDTQVLAGNQGDKCIDVVFTDAVYAHKRPQGVHERMDREPSGKDMLGNRCAHLPDNAKADADPGLAFLKQAGNVGACHLIDGF